MKGRAAGGAGRQAGRQDGRTGGKREEREEERGEGGKVERRECLRARAVQLGGFKRRLPAPSSFVNTT
jgi:hypothetical protein